MEERNLVVVLSDIHMGTDAPTVWYRKETHEKYLLAVLDYIIDLADNIEEVVWLGDIFEFWSYPPEVLPPTLEEIIAVHKNILGEEGKLRKALSALKGRMVYIPGDHDMNVSRADLNKLKSKDGFVIKFHYGAYFPIYAPNIMFVHGHEFTVLNSPYFASHLSPLPIGYFVSRAMSHKIQNTLKYTSKNSIGELEEYSAFSYHDFLPKLPFYYENFQGNTDAVSNFIDALMQATEMKEDTPIQVNLFTARTLEDVKKIYQNKGIMGHEIELKSVIADYNKMDVSPELILGCCKESTNHIIMGHTHVPAIYQKKYKYINTGYMCPPVSKLQINPPTFGIYEISKQRFKLMKTTGINCIQITPFHKTNPFCKKTLLGKKINQIENEASVKLKIEESMPFDTNQLTYGWSVYNASLEYWQAMQAGVLAKASELNIEIIAHDERSDSVEMVTGSNDLIRQGIDALLIAPYNPELLPGVVESADKYNIPVVAVDTGTGGADVAAFIVSDNFGGGILAGEYALDLIKEYRIISKNFAIIKVQKTAQNALLRGEGFKRVLVGEGFQLVEQPTANSSEEEAYIEMKRMLLTYEDNLAVVFCENGLMALGAARAIVEEGKKGKILVIGFDADPAVLEAIERGDMQGTIAQQPFEMGEVAVETASMILRGEEVIFDDWREKIILMEVFLVNEKGEFSSSA